ncbi:hypothetical protein F751_1506 [Auxenochlorella protothecoides]|uniref:Uncharacterized protein n=1 Tax=Auxenochlorella protothecoides TaxID=3075 RepID=A0A087SJI8_AUXPR|nr:hypothetical protein F751_1506 [Auxenochlorella protothecoides]KFM25892.1 hypothetical protein F751_1506 [Auxenochlorella protothecoides]
MGVDEIRLGPHHGREHRPLLAMVPPALRVVAVTPLPCFPAAAPSPLPALPPLSRVLAVRLCAVASLRLRVQARELVDVQAPWSRAGMERVPFQSTGGCSRHQS